MMLVLNDMGNEYKEHDHDDGYVGSSMLDINLRKFKRNEEEICYRVGDESSLSHQMNMFIETSLLQYYNNNDDN
jgi:hypothetical protein